jgi:hypothetical protein
MNEEGDRYFKCPIVAWHTYEEIGPDGEPMLITEGIGLDVSFPSMFVLMPTGEVLEWGQVRWPTLDAWIADLPKIAAAMKADDAQDKRKRPTVVPFPPQKH